MVIDVRQKMAAVTSYVRPYMTAGLNLLFPPRCAGCGQDVSAPHSLCSDCFSGLHFITEPMCSCCGTPFPYEVEAGAVCAICMDTPPLYDSARAVWDYTDRVRPLITRFKYADQTHRLPGYAKLLAQVGADTLSNVDAIVPVPLHPKRLHQRKYNQSSLLAHALAKRTGLAVWDKALLRTRDTPPQAGLDRPGRLENVKDAFAVNHAYAERLRGKRIVLIDDVTTTGATIHACCHALRQAKLTSMHVLTLAKTVRD